MKLTVRKWSDILESLKNAADDSGDDDRELFAITDAIDSAIDGKEPDNETEIFLTEEQEQTVESHS